jgi:hypothetical protein
MIFFFGDDFFILLGVAVLAVVGFSALLGISIMEWIVGHILLVCIILLIIHIVLSVGCFTVVEENTNLWVAGICTLINFFAVILEVIMTYNFMMETYVPGEGFGFWSFVETFFSITFLILLPEVIWRDSLDHFGSWGISIVTILCALYPISVKVLFCPDMFPYFLAIPGFSL